MLISLLSISLALVLDWLLGEPRRYHPLVLFGHFAKQIEHRFNHALQPNSRRFLYGVCAWCMVVLPLTFAGYLLSSLPYFGTVFPIIVLYFCIAHRSLYDHIKPISHALTQGNIDEAKHYTSYIVSRDAAHIEVEKASIESVLENGNDAIFGALFWFILLGAPGAILYRLANTLDAMWGYKTPQFLYFGKAAARIDDLLNLIPARLTALSYALIGQTRLALHCWFNQAKTWDSPNAGPVMAAGAGALNIALGGEAIYHGKVHQRPRLGSAIPAHHADIPRALTLVSKSVGLWLLVFAVLTGVSYA